MACLSPPQMEGCRGGWKDVIVQLTGHEKYGIALGVTTATSQSITLEA